MNYRTKILAYHRSMVRDSVRVERYRSAILSTVKPGDVVLDLGTGTGLQAFFACQAGARRVYAVEAGDIVHIARHLCRANGLEDRVIFVEGMSDQVSLPEPVDVVISETLGNIGLDEGVLGWVADASKRFLKEGGTIIPASVTVHAVPVEAPDSYEALDFSRGELFGLDFSPMRRFVCNNQWSTQFTPDAFLADPLPIAKVELARIETLSSRSEVSFKATRSGTVHGIGGWFAAALTDTIHISNAPPNEAPSWNQILFPLEVPIRVCEGDTLRLFIRTVNGREWRWKLEAHPAGSGQKPRSSGEHATLYGFPLSMQALKRQSATYAPTLSHSGRIELSALSLFDGEKTISDIANELMSQYPDFFPSESAAGAFVRRAVQRSSQ